MIYQNERAIYVKIADRVCDDILSGKYQEDERVPSVRELAAEYEVNTNTVLFVAPGARHKIRIARKQEFRKHELPEFLRRLRLLGMTIDDVVKAWEETQDSKG